jgi:glycosyltransferase involved in cell wall biosynthesis
VKILHVVQELGVGGLPTYVFDISKGLIAKGHECSIVHSTGEVPKIYERDSAHLNYLDGLQVASGPSDYRAQKELDAILKAFAPTIVFVHLLSNHRLLRSLLASGIPVVRMFHDFSSVCLRKARQYRPGERCQRAFGWGCIFRGCFLGNPKPGTIVPRYTSFLAKRLELNLYRQVNLALVASNYMRSVLLKNGFRSSKIAVVPCFTSFADCSHSGNDRSEGSLRSKLKHTLLFCGQVIPPKGLHILIRALRLIDPNWSLHVVGDGIDLPRVKKLSKDLGVEERIEFSGWLPHDETYLAYLSSDIVIVPSISDETFGIVGVEAMACGKPVVGFNVGGFSDWLRNGVTGLMVDDVIPSNLASAIQTLIDNREMRERMGKQAKALASKLYSLSQHLGELLKEMDNVGRQK